MLFFCKNPTAVTTHLWKFRFIIVRDVRDIHQRRCFTVQCLYRRRGLCVETIALKFLQYFPRSRIAKQNMSSTRCSTKSCLRSHTALGVARALGSLYSVFNRPPSNIMPSVPFRCFGSMLLHSRFRLYLFRRPRSRMFTRKSSQLVQPTTHRR